MSNLADVSVSIAARGCGEFLRKHGVDNIGPTTEAVWPFLRDAVKAALPAALDDARDAFTANMGKVAEQTFSASMVIAGIDGAKAYLRSIGREIP